MLFLPIDKTTHLRDNETKILFTVRNPQTCDNFQWLLGQTVEILEEQWKVLGVEHFMHSPPYYRSELIRLLVEKT